MTKEETKQAIEVMQAWYDGKPVQYRNNTKNAWYDLTSEAPVAWDWSIFSYRVKSAPPTPKYRAWTAEEFPLGCWLRHKSDHASRYFPSFTSSVGIVISFHGNILKCESLTILYHNILEHYEHSLDGGKTWAPCGTLVTEE